MSVFLRAVEQSFGVALDGRQRGAQLVRNVGDKIAAGFFHAFSLSEVAEDGDGAAAGHWRSGYVEGSAWENGRRPGGGYFAQLTGLMHRRQEIGVTDGLDQEGVAAGFLGN